MEIGGQRLLGLNVFVANKERERAFIYQWIVEDVDAI
jgi:hypothetical protein